MEKEPLKIKVETEGIDELIEKVSRLNELLKEANVLIDSLTARKNKF